MKEYLKLFPDGFDDTLEERRAIENWPFVGYDELTEELVFTTIPKPATGPADNEIWYSTVDHIAHGPIDAAGLTGDDEMTVEILPYDTELDRGVLRFSKKLSELRCGITADG